MNIKFAQKDLSHYPKHDLVALAKHFNINHKLPKDKLSLELAKVLHRKQARMPIGYNNATILVTGGAGFIGSNLVDKLLNMGAKVRVLDNLSTGNLQNLTDAMKNPQFKFIQGDIRSLDICKQACENVDIVFHEAALVSVPKSMDDPVLNNDINITGMLNMLIAASAAKVKRFVYASSAAVYGDDPIVPKKESMPRHYPSPYALSKGVDEDYATLWAYKDALGNGMTCVGLRYFNVYGPRQDPKSPYSGVISIFTDKVQKEEQVVIFGDGMQTRDFVFVQDVVQANVLAGLTPLAAGESRVYNVGTGQSVTLLKLLDTIRRIKGIGYIQTIHKESRTGDIRDSLADITKITTDIGYSPKYSLVDGLTQLLNK